MLGMVYRNIRQGLIDMEAMFALIDTPADIVVAPDAPLLQIEAGEVRFENVHFSYTADREIPHGIDIHIQAGTTLAIVGPSGAGKERKSLVQGTRGSVRVGRGGRRTIKKKKT